MAKFLGSSSVAHLLLNCVNSFIDSMLPAFQPTNPCAPSEAFPAWPCEMSWPLFCWAQWLLEIHLQAWARHWSSENVRMTQLIYITHWTAWPAAGRSTQRRRQVWRFRRGPGEFVIIGCLAPYPPPSTKKILTRFLRFAWTPLGSSGGSGALDTPRPATPLSLPPKMFSSRAWQEIRN